MRTLVLMAGAGLILGALYLKLADTSVDQARERAEVETRQDLQWIARYVADERQPGGALAAAKDEAAIITALRESWLADVRQDNAKIWDADATGRAVDGWGTPIKIQMTGAQVVVCSAGQDRKWGTADDLSASANSL